jgi:adenine-specific DNA-methyltransferase
MAKEYNKLSKEELLKLVEKQDAELELKKYGLVWDREREPEKVVLDCENNAPILERILKKEIRTDTSDDNILIEGDNYHALTVLNYTHKGKIDVIYIDPPYNTGNKDFVYNDKYIDKEDIWRHSKWLNFMEKRLLLAEKLLKETGVIFISIDDNEFAQLKLVCDKIFREQNFVSTIIWQRSYSPKNQSRHISVDHEYLLVYAKNIEHLEIKLLPRTEKMNARYKNLDHDSRGVWKPGDLVANEERKNGHYTIVGPNGDKFEAPSGKHWSYAQDKMLEIQKDDRLYFGKKGDAFPSLKQFLDEVQQGRKASSLFFHDEVGHTDEAKKELKEFFEQSDDLFSTPKPTRLINQVIRLAGGKNDLILDFMAGSGTTGHSILELNKEDGGNRKFILCTNNENKICEEVTYPRIQKVIKGYKTPKGEKIAGLEGNLQYFKTALIPVERIDNVSDEQRREITEKAGQMIAMKENTFEEVETNDWYQIFENKDKSRKTAIYFREATDKFPELLKKIQKENVVLYVFSYGRIDKKLFAHLPKNIVVDDVPEPILEIYKEINLTLKDK